MNETTFNADTLQDRTPNFVTHDNLEEILSLDLSLDGSLVLTGSFDDTAHCYLVTNGSKELTYTDRPHGIENLKFTSNNDLIYSNRKGKLGTLKKISLNNNTLLWVSHNCHTGKITGLDTGIYNNLVTVSNDRAMRLWDLKCDKCISVTNFNGNGLPKARFDPSCSVIALYNMTETKAYFKFFDVRKTVEPFTTTDFLHGQINDFEFSDGAMHILVSTERNGLVLLNSIDGTELKIIKEYRNDVGSTIGSLTENSKFVAVGCESNNQVKVFDTENGELVSEMFGHLRTPRRVIWSKHYGVLFSACHNLIYWVID